MERRKRDKSGTCGGTGKGNSQMSTEKYDPWNNREASSLVTKRHQREVTGHQHLFGEVLAVCPCNVGSDIDGVRHLSVN